jgi:hypothetical protein
MKNIAFYKKWVLLALFNFIILAAAGVLLRYKILFPLPFVEQKHLLHGHSHFAFAGWVSLSLYLLTIYLLQPGEALLKKMEWLLVAQQMASYGMLFTFPVTGYATASISFSTMSILISWAYAWLVIQELTERHFRKKVADNRSVVQCNFLNRNLYARLFNGYKEPAAGLVFWLRLFLSSFSVQWIFPVHHWSFIYSLPVKHVEAH